MSTRRRLTGSGYQKGYEAGVKAEYDKFWDAFQYNGNRKNYSYAFYQSYWNDTTYNPKYAINGTNLQFCFRYAGITDTKVDIDLRNTTTENGVSGIFSNASKLKTIRKLIVDEATPFATNIFSECEALEDLTIEGIIGQNNFKVSASTKLSRDSIVSIINALSATTSGLTVTLSNTAVNNAFETTEGAADGSSSAEWTALAATKSNWTITLS